MPWKKGESGNKNGRPKGTGEYQRQARIKAHERVMNLRLQNALAAVDARKKIISDYLEGAGEFAFLIDDGAKLVEFVPERDWDSIKTRKPKCKPVNFKEHKIVF